MSVKATGRQSWNNGDRNTRNATKMFDTTVYNPHQTISYRDYDERVEQAHATPSPFLPLPHSPPDQVSRFRTRWDLACCEGGKRTTQENNVDAWKHEEYSCFP